MRKGEVWYVKISQGSGHEQRGTRPAIILAKYASIITVIPLTSNTDRATMNHTYTIDPKLENGLTEYSTALIFQISTHDEAKFIKKIGQISQEDQQHIDLLIKNYMCLK